MRILILSDYFPTPTNPLAGTWALAHARGLADEGAEVRVISPVPAIPWPLSKLGKARVFAQCPPSHDYGPVHVEYPRWPYYNIGPLRTMYARHPKTCAMAARWLRAPIRTMFSTWRPDVVFAHHSIPNGLTARWIKSDFGIPFVVEDHDFGSVESCRYLDARRRGFNKVMSAASAAIAPAQRITQAHRELFPDTRALTIYNGARAIPVEMKQRPRPVDLRDKLIVFTAAFFYERKGICELIEVFSRIAQTHPAAMLRIAGDGVLRDKVKAAVARAALGDRIQLLGKLSHEQTLQEMVWADVFALIGWEEPFATVYLESMAAGTPILCCNDGGICQVLQDRVHGRTVPPHDLSKAAEALDELLGNPSLRQTMGEACFALFEAQLNASVCAKKTLALLGDVIATKVAQR